jgi:hypothetical protein
VRALNFYTNCTLRKSVVVPKALSLADIEADFLEARFAKWTTRLDKGDYERVEANALYSGGHWSVVRNIQRAETRNGLPLHCRVISAGYGLLSTSNEICPYAATFAPGHPDSVSPVAGKTAPNDCREWWKMLAKWKPVKLSGPRSFRELFKQEADSIHLFAISPTYLDAISDDLLDALEVLLDKDDLIIISCGKMRHGRLNDHIITAADRLQTRFGGALASLKVRLAAEIIKRLLAGGTRPNGVRRLIAKLSSQSKPRPVFKRRPVADSVVSRFIERELRKESASSYTRLLRRFRESGRACEMRRFRDIHAETKSRLYATKKSGS